MILNDVEYFYVRNGQGDIIALTDSNGNEVVSYTYDSWGKLISIKDENGNDVTGDNTKVGQINLYRYRGYRYDTETGLYYLQSRYYNPEWGRFINADATGVLTVAPMELSNKNLYAYCDNNPITRADNSGYLWHIAIGAAVGATFSIASTVVTNMINGDEWYKDAGYSLMNGLLSGALAATTAGVGGQVIGNAIFSGATETLKQAFDKKKGFQINSIVKESALGAVTGGFGGKGVGTKSLKKLSSQTVKRTVTKLKHTGVKAALVEGKRALSYSLKHSKYFVKPMLKESWRPAIYSAIYGYYDERIYDFSYESYNKLFGK